MTEHQVAELLERATADLRPTTDLVAAGIADGRRRHRRGLAIAAAGALAAAAVVGGAVSLSPSNGSAPGRDVVADDPSTATSSYAAQPLAPSNAPEPSPIGPFPVAPDAMASTLASLL